MADDRMIDLIDEHGNSYKFVDTTPQQKSNGQKAYKKYVLSQKLIFEYNYQPPKSDTDRSPQFDATGGNGLSRASERLATHCIGCAVGFSSPKQIQHARNNAYHNKRYAPCRALINHKGLHNPPAGYFWKPWTGVFSPQMANYSIYRSAADGGFMPTGRHLPLEAFIFSSPVVTYQPILKN